MNFKEFLENKKENYYPTGVYIAVLPNEKTEKAIKKFQDKYLKNVKANDELHTTLIYSNKPQKEKIQPNNNTYAAHFAGFDLFGEEKDTLVMKLSSDALSSRNKDLTKKYNFVSDYDSYNPHITLAYDVKDFDVNSLSTFNEEIILENEYIEDLNDDWKPE